MNWRRGLFRLWIVGTVLFVLSVAFVSYSEIKAEFDAIASIPKSAAPSSILAQTRQLYPEYKDWNDDQLADAVYKRFYSDIPREEFNRRIATATGEQIADALARHKKSGTFDLPPPPNPWATLGMWASIAFGVPLAVLVLGASLVWAFSGFAAKRS
jgi:hypothetical protein